MTSDPRKLSDSERLRAYYDAINDYIAMYGASGGDDDGREEFSKSQDAMFIPAEFRGRVYALKVNPMIFRRILLREYREEVVDNEEQIKREIREKEKKLEEEQKKLEKAKKEEKKNEEVHQDRKNQMMIAQQHRDNALFALGMAGGAISMAQIERMELKQMEVRHTAKKLQKPKEKGSIKKEVRRLSFLANVKGNPKLLAEHNKIRKLRGLPPLDKDGKPINLPHRSARKAPTNQNVREVLIAKRKKEREGSGSYH
jgi:hypothetical protein